MFLYGTQIRGANERVAIFVREIDRDLNIQINFADHTGNRIAVNARNNANTIGGDAALAAEAKDIDAGAGADGSEKEGKGCGRASNGGLVGWYCKTAKMGVHAGTAGKVNNHFHVQSASPGQDDVIL